MRKVKCNICHEEHEVDNTNWVQMCLGYFPAEVMELDEYDMKRMIKQMKLMMK